MKGLMYLVTFFFLHTRILLALTEVQFHFRELVKVLSVVYGVDIDREGCGPLPDVVPVHGREPRQFLDLGQAGDAGIGAVTEPLDGLLGRSGHRDLSREFEILLPPHDLGVGFLGRLRAERRVAYEHLKHDDAERPPVAGAVVAGLLENLWGDVVGGANCGVGEGAPLATPGLSPPPAVHPAEGEVSGCHLGEETLLM